MNLSTFSSRNELKTCIAVIVLLLTVELFLHSRQNLLSKDLEHLASMPAIAESFRESNVGKVLFLGNSLTRAGVDLDVVAEHFSGGRFKDVKWKSAYPDDTTLRDWYYLYKNAFYRAGRTPDVLVLGFVRDQISDLAQVHPDGIAGSMGGLRNVPEIFQDDITEQSARIEYTLASVSMLFANRDRIRTRVADALIPRYRETAQYFNRSVQSQVQSKTVYAPQTFRHLIRLAELCRSSDTLLVVVGMPVPEPYAVDPNLPKILGQAGGVSIDLQRIEGMQPEDFLDGYHLNPHGAVLYSQMLAETLEAQPAVQSALAKHRTFTTSR